MNAIIIKKELRIFQRAFAEKAYEIRAIRYEGEENHGTGGRAVATEGMAGSQTLKRKRLDKPAIPGKAALWNLKCVIALRRDGDDLIAD